MTAEHKEVETMPYRTPVRDALVGTPGALAVGVTKAYLANQLNPALAQLPVAPRGWYFDAALLAIGLVGLGASAYTKDDTWFEMTEGVLFAGETGLAEHITHAVLQNNPNYKDKQEINAVKRVMAVQPVEPVVTFQPQASMGSGWGAEY